MNIKQSAPTTLFILMVLLSSCGPSDSRAVAAVSAKEMRGVVFGSDEFGRWMNISIGNEVVKMRYIEAVKFTMGSDGDYYAETPVHNVGFSHGYWMGSTEVTQALWHEVMNDAAINPASSNLPVCGISWIQANAFCAQLSSRISVDVSLPTEAEWEFASMGGEDSKWIEEGQMNKIGWMASNSGGDTHPIAEKQCNKFGLFDMFGNAAEWCMDRFGPYSSRDCTDPVILTGESRRVFRGGWAMSPLQECQPAFRMSGFPRSGKNTGIGLRIVCRTEF